MIKGEITGDEDLVIEGNVEGLIKLRFSTPVCDLDGICDRSAIGGEIIAQIHLIVKLDHSDTVPW